MKILSSVSKNWKLEQKNEKLEQKIKIRTKIVKSDEKNKRLGQKRLKCIINNQKK